MRIAKCDRAAIFFATLVRLTIGMRTGSARPPKFRRFSAATNQVAQPPVTDNLLLPVDLGTKPGHEKSLVNVPP